MVLLVMDDDTFGDFDNFIRKNVYKTNKTGKRWTFHGLMTLLVPSILKLGKWYTIQKI